MLFPGFQLFVYVSSSIGHYIYLQPQINNMREALDILIQIHNEDVFQFAWAFRKAYISSIKMLTFHLNEKDRGSYNHN